MKLKSEITVLDVLGHLIIWALLSLVTFGIALFFFPYSFSKFVINRTSLIDDRGIERKMQCDIDLFSNLGHVILWLIISVLTLGIGYVFYFYRVWNYALNNTSVK
ncbi:DUF6693 family protein [Vibrio furnissii]|uniref:DUF6693 family protein n=1 Tax=Vibrio furnissii TaxID=29494 RepID=UPI00399AC3DF